MTFNLPSSDQVNSALRHVYTAGGTIAATVTTIGLLPKDTVDQLVTAVHDIGDGGAQILRGIAILVPLVSGAYAMISASRASRMKALNADPQIKKIETVPGTPAAAEAATIPGNKVS